MPDAIRFKSEEPYLQEAGCQKTLFWRCPQFKVPKTHIDLIYECKLQHSEIQMLKKVLAILNNRHPASEHKETVNKIYPPQPSLSRFLYVIASARCSGLMSTEPERSAIVLLTLRIRS